MALALLGCSGRSSPGDGSSDQAAEDVHEDTGQPCPDPAYGFFVSPSGTSSGDGTAGSPWDLATALSGAGGRVGPGDTIWLRGGVYSGNFVSDLSGTAEEPITVRALPGERVTLDGASAPSDRHSLEVNGDHTIYQGFEITNTTSDRSSRAGGFQVGSGGTGNRLANLIVHDTGGNSTNGAHEIYGCLFHSNGRGDNLTHDLYNQNSSDGEHIIEDNVIMYSGGFGIHAYSGGVAFLRHFRIRRNVWFGAGYSRDPVEDKDNCLVGGVNGTDDNLLEENVGWAVGPDSRSVSLGDYGDTNGTIALVGNTIVGAVSFENEWDSITIDANTFYGPVTSSAGIDVGSRPGNAYLSEAPTENVAFVFANRYESGRAHVAVFNWEDLDEVEVDLSGVLEPGQAFEVRNAQDFFAPPVLESTFDGAPLALPMDGLTVHQPVGGGSIPLEVQPGRAFNVFVILPAGC